jgi:hypothetical protein
MTTAETIAKTKPESVGARPSASSAQSAFDSKSNPTDSFGAASQRTVVTDAAGSADGGVGGNIPTARANSLKLHSRTAADRADANLAPQSAREKTGASGWGARL